MKKYLKYLILIPVLVSCFQEKECPDVTDPEFPLSNLEWFSYEVGDTLLFWDADRSKSHYLTCTSKNEYLDPEFTTNHDCVNDGWLDLRRVLNQKFTSNFPHTENKFLNLTLNLDGSPNSTFNLYFGSNSHQSYYAYECHFRYDYEDIVRRTDYSAIVSYIDSLAINDVNYQDVYIISHYRASGVNEYLYYDTIYYNKDGFLKFISSEYGYRLERLP